MTNRADDKVFHERKKSEGSCLKRLPITLNGMSLKAETIKMEAITGIGI